MRSIKSLALSLFLAYSIILMGCSQSQINRAVSIASTIPGLVSALNLPQAELALKLVNEVVAGIKIFRDNPTRGNFQNAMAAIDHALASDVFKLKPMVVAVIQALRVTFAAIVPSDDGARMSADPNEKVNVKDISKQDVDVLEARVKALKAEAGK